VPSLWLKQEAINFWNYAIQVNLPIHVVVDNGHVTLSGVVNSEVEHRKAETIARSAFSVFGSTSTRGEAGPGGSSKSSRWSAAKNRAFARVVLFVKSCPEEATMASMKPAPPSPAFDDTAGSQRPELYVARNNSSAWATNG